MLWPRIRFFIYDLYNLYNSLYMNTIHKIATIYYPKNIYTLIHMVKICITYNKHKTYDAYSKNIGTLIYYYTWMFEYMNTS